MIFENISERLSSSFVLEIVNREKRQSKSNIGHGFLSFNKEFIGIFI